MITTEAMMKLQNGSDVRGVAIAGVPGEDVTLVPEAVNRIAAGFAKFLAKKLNKQTSDLRIAVGHDSRVSAGMMKEAVFGGLLGQGVHVTDCGLASTPAMFMSIIFEDTHMDGSIMITASHLPYNRNGLKFFTVDGVLFEGNAQKQIKELEAFGLDKMPICVAKTQYSLSDNPALLGAPKGFKVTVKDVRVCTGAGFIVCQTSNIMTMPGLPKVPAANRMDIDENGIITGLF